MPTNPQADGQTKVDFQISTDEKAALKALADSCVPKMKVSAYVRLLVSEALAARRRFVLESEFNPLASEDTQSATDKVALQNQIISDAKAKAAAKQGGAKAKSGK